MNTLILTSADGLEDLNLQEQQLLGSGIPLAPLVWGTGLYLAKTCGDHWGEFKDGIAGGFQAIWGHRE